MTPLDDMERERHAYEVWWSNLARRRNAYRRDQEREAKRLQRDKKRLPRWSEIPLHHRGTVEDLDRFEATDFRRNWSMMPAAYERRREAIRHPHCPIAVGYRDDFKFPCAAKVHEGETYCRLHKGQAQYDTATFEEVPDVREEWERRVRLYTGEGR